MRRGKSQYSVEFLITYGWALLILGIIVGTIYTFGWLDPGNFLPQKCHFYGQVGCRDYYLTNETFNISVVNNFGVDLYIKDLELIIGGDTVTVEGNWTNSDIRPWNRSDFVKVGIDIGNSYKLIIGDRVDAIAIVRYFSNQTCSGCYANGIGTTGCSLDCIHEATGRVLVKVQED